jgi:ubiquinone/menaquinone biosynthesis C-methylase UbiE
MTWNGFTGCFQSPYFNCYDGHWSYRGEGMSIETQVSAHYTHGDLLNSIDAALAKAGKNPAAPSLQDLAPIDEFHVRGREATAELGAHLGLQEEHRVLDVGSGLGGASRQLAADYKCHITGIDLTEEYCRAATVLASRVGLSDRVRYQQGSALAMPFADNSFDIAYTQHVAMNIADKGGLYREIARVLKPGGRFGIYDVLQGQGGPVIYPVPWAQDASTSFLAIPDEMRDLLSDAGFDVTNWNDTSEIGKEWFKAVSKRMTESGPSPLGFQVFLGTDFPTMAKNQVRNLTENRIRLTEIICVKRQ